MLSWRLNADNVKVDVLRHTFPYAGNCVTEASYDVNFNLFLTSTFSEGFRFRHFSLKHITWLDKWNMYRLFSVRTLIKTTSNGFTLIPYLCLKHLSSYAKSTGEKRQFHYIVWLVSRHTDTSHCSLQNNIEIGLFSSENKCLWNDTAIFSIFLSMIAQSLYCLFVHNLKSIWVHQSLCTFNHFEAKFRYMETAVFFWPKIICFVECSSLEGKDDSVYFLVRNRLILQW